METIKTEIAVIGAGPGGYAAAFQAADAGRQVVLIDKSARLGGVCLNAGCIPSKALLNATHMIPAAKESARRGIVFSPPEIDLAKLLLWKEGVLNKLANGIALLAKKRSVSVLHGSAGFLASDRIEVQGPNGAQIVEAQHFILATGTEPALPAAFDLGSPRVMTSTEALHPDSIPATLLIVGGGYIGMELGTVYASLGTEVTLVEALGGILTGADPDLARPVHIYAKRNFKQLHLQSTVKSLTDDGSAITVEIQSGEKTMSQSFEKVLVSVGRRPNTGGLRLENTGCRTNERGFVETTGNCRTHDPHIHAIGDINGGIMLAHKAVHDARVAVDDIVRGVDSSKVPHIPAVVFTDPEIAWVGLTEGDAIRREIPHTVSKFSWGANGRSLTQDRIDGVTKLIVAPDTEKVLGVGIVGHGAGELIGEATLALELGATAADLANTVHPHPTLSETIMEAAEAFYGRAVHALPRNN
jgi:dihydrolipoamide dehydrogenase